MEKVKRKVLKPGIFSLESKLDRKGNVVFLGIITHVLI